MWVFIKHISFYGCVHIFDVGSAIKGKNCVLKILFYANILMCTFLFSQVNKLKCVTGEDILITMDYFNKERFTNNIAETIVWFFEHNMFSE